MYIFFKKKPLFPLSFVDIMNMLIEEHAELEIITPRKANKNSEVIICHPKNTCQRIWILVYSEYISDGIIAILGKLILFFIIQTLIDIHEKCLKYFI